MPALDAESEKRRVAHELLTRIVSGAYPPGLRLPAENDLADTLECGRSTVREALTHLASLGVVKSRRGSGAMVLDFRREGTPGLLPFYVLAGRFDRPVGVLAREFLAMRTLLATQAVRLAARYADARAIAEARAILARAPALERDPAAHAGNELDFFRALVTGSGILPAVWLANVFWAPMREIQDQLAGTVGKVPTGYQPHMTRLLDLIEKRAVTKAEAHVTSWFERVDEGLAVELEQLLGVAAGVAGFGNVGLANGAPAGAPPPAPTASTKRERAAASSAKARPKSSPARRHAGEPHRRNTKGVKR
jgi:DNA-binding FadR family transcriptional regulator